MSLIVVDVEADGEIPNKYSMVCFGAVIVEPILSKTFYGQTKPISKNWNPEALAISGFSREEHKQFDDPKKVMEQFAAWIKENSKGKPVFISDNLAFDWQWINYYFHFFLTGMDSSLNHEWKKLYRKTGHDHNPVNDAKGNAEALLEMRKLGLKFHI